MPKVGVMAVFLLLFFLIWFGGLVLFVKSQSDTFVNLLYHHAETVENKVSDWYPYKIRRGVAKYEILRRYHNPEIVSWAIYSAANAENYVAQKRAVDLLIALKNRGVNFFHDGSNDCSSTQATLKLMQLNTAYKDEHAIKKAKLQFYLMSEKERNLKFSDSKYASCRTSVNEYLADKQLKRVFNEINIPQYILTTLEGDKD